LQEDCIFKICSKPKLLKLRRVREGLICTGHFEGASIKREGIKRSQRKWMVERNIEGGLVQFQIPKGVNTVGLIEEDAVLDLSKLNPCNLKRLS